MVAAPELSAPAPSHDREDDGRQPPVHAALLDVARQAPPEELRARMESPVAARDQWRQQVHREDPWIMCAEQWITDREAEKCDNERTASDDGHDTEYEESLEEGPASRRRAGFRAGQ